MRPLNPHHRRSSRPLSQFPKIVARTHFAGYHQYQAFPPHSRGAFIMNALLLSVALLAPAQQPQPAPKATANDVGVLPLGADGKPLNLDFETGDLKDWTLEGEAFKG